MQKAKRLILNCLSKALSHYGYTITNRIPLKWLENIKVDEVIDVGVARGTNILLKNFPSAYYHFIEANPKYYSFIKGSLLKKYKGTLYQYAVGADHKKKEFYMWDENSSFFKRFTKDITAHSIKIDMYPIDTLINASLLSKNSLLKIDVEGGELDVLKGAQKLINSVKFIMVELRLLDIETYNPSELISFLYDRGFIWFGLCDVAYRPRGVNYIDVMFKKNCK